MEGKTYLTGSNVNTRNAKCIGTLLIVLSDKKKGEIFTPGENII